MPLVSKSTAPYVLAKKPLPVTVKDVPGGPPAGLSMMVGMAGVAAFTVKVAEACPVLRAKAARTE